MTGLGGRIKQSRLAANLTQEEVARMASIRRATLSDIESGITKHPRSNILQCICVALNVDIDWMLNGPDPAPSEMSQLDRIEQKLDAVLKFISEFRE